jgi:hypothetical protein
MDKVQELCDSECYTPSSEPFKNLLVFDMISTAFPLPINSLLIIFPVLDKNQKHFGQESCSTPDIRKLRP